jgi:hypothetical protein
MSDTENKTSAKIQYRLLIDEAPEEMSAPPTHVIFEPDLKAAKQILRLVKIIKAEGLMMVEKFVLNDQMNVKFHCDNVNSNFSASRDIEALTIQVFDYKIRFVALPKGYGIAGQIVSDDLPIATLKRDFEAALSAEAAQAEVAAIVAMDSAGDVAPDPTSARDMFGM